jgi:hypothetical protein
MSMKWPPGRIAISARKIVLTRWTRTWNFSGRITGMPIQNSGSPFGATMSANALTRRAYSAGQPGSGQVTHLPRLIHRPWTSLPPNMQITASGGNAATCAAASFGHEKKSGRASPVELLPRRWTS